MLKYCEEMKNQSIKECNPKDLVDLNTISINPLKNKAERIIDYITQIRNPYLFTVGDIIVKVTFSEKDVTFQTKIEELVAANLNR